MQGVAAANRLRRRLDRQYRVVLVNREEDFSFAASYLWVVTVARRPSQVTSPLTSPESTRSATTRTSCSVSASRCLALACSPTGRPTPWPTPSPPQSRVVATLDGSMATAAASSRPAPVTADTTIERKPMEGSAYVLQAVSPLSRRTFSSRVRRATRDASAALERGTTETIKWKPATRKVFGTQMLLRRRWGRASRDCGSPRAALVSRAEARGYTRCIMGRVNIQVFMAARVTTSTAKGASTRRCMARAGYWRLAMRYTA